MTAYSACKATTPLDPAAREALIQFLDEDFGNAGSRTHEFGAVAKRATQEARAQVANAIGARADEVLFTSGATESNNIAILGMSPFGIERGRKHIVTTRIEHKAVLEPVQRLQQQGFDVTFVDCYETGRVRADDILAAVRDDTLLVSVMHVNNETGVLQPIEAIADGLEAHKAFLHVDAAQGFGKATQSLKHKRIQLISISGHKIYGPKGIGALVARRDRERPPLSPLMVGGGQERGLRPGTLPVPLIAAFGVACDLAGSQEVERMASCLQIKHRILSALGPIGGVVNGAAEFVVPSTLNISFPGIDSEAVMLVLKDLIAVSNGSACTSTTYEPSHVLSAMGLSEDRINGAIRLSWMHMSEEPDWSEVAARISSLK
jgi:cysteine desulfurase